MSGSWFKKFMDDLLIKRFAEIDSTNNEAKRFLQDTNTDKAALFIAKCQTGGRGRQGKSFYSPSGGMYMSLLLPREIDLSKGLSLTAVSAVAVCEILREYNVFANIKWVNDVYWQDKKLCGILCESLPDISGKERYISGIGVNLHEPEQGFPSEIANKIIALNVCIDPVELAKKIAESILEMVDSGLDSDALYEKYKLLSRVLGKRIIYSENGEEKSAQVIDINRDGSLKIIGERGIENLSSGEISLLSF